MNPAVTWLVQYLTYWRFTAEFLLMSFLFNHSLGKAPHFRLKWILIALSSLVMTIPVTFLGQHFLAQGVDSYRYTTFAIYSLLMIPFIVSCLICYKTSLSNKFFVFISSNILHDFTRTTYYLVLFILGRLLNQPSIYLIGSDNDIYLLIYYPLFAIVIILFNLLFRKVTAHPRFVKFDKRFTILLSTFVLLQALAGLIQARLQADSPLEYGMFLVFNLLSTLVTLSMQFLIVFSTTKLLENEALEQKHMVHVHEFELLQDNMELINHKVHDLRHQLRAAELGANMDPTFLSEFQRSLRIYDNSFDTGCKELDLILTDLKFRAENHHIDVDVMADGKAILFMQRQDIVSLFSNILENAFNYEKALTDIDHRSIRLRVGTKNGFVHIEEENPLGPTSGQKVDSRDGYHGYGIPSIKRITKKYGGYCSLKQDQGRFHLSITLPSAAVE